VLTIYKGEAKTEVEKITLSDYNDTERLHKLFAKKGFTKYTEDELDANRQEEMPKHFAHLEANKRPAEVGKAQQNFKTAKEIKDGEGKFYDGRFLCDSITGVGILIRSI
jgi:hypothetical protein